MNAKIKITKDVRLEDITIGKHNLLEIFDLLHSKITVCVREISIQNQSENPDYTDIDSPLHGALNIIEEIIGS